MTAVLSSPARRRRIPVRQVLCLLPLLLVTVVAVRHRQVLAEGFGHLATAKWPWLLAAAGATCLTWVAVATAVVLAFRIITVWVPLLPEALTLGALMRFKVI